jgi:hypothetical protein
MSQVWARLSTREKRDEVGNLKRVDDRRKPAHPPLDRARLRRAAGAGLHHFFREVESPPQESSWEEDAWKHTSQVRLAQSPEEAEPQESIGP